MQTGANDVYCIRTEEHGEVLIPAIKDCILDVDVEAGKMKIHLMDDESDRFLTGQIQTGIHVDKKQLCKRLYDYRKERVCIIMYLHCFPR